MIYKKYWGTHGDPILPKEKYGEPNVRLSHIKSNILAFKITVSTRFFAKFWGAMHNLCAYTRLLFTQNG